VKTRTMFAFGLFVVPLGLSTASGLAGGKKEQLPPPKASPADLLPKPGPEHKMLASFAGSWSVKAKAYSNPKQPPEESSGTLTRKVVLDGLFLQEELKAHSKAGFTLSGLGLVGYDVFRKQFVSSWVDNLGTGIMVNYGTYDAKSRTISYVFEDVDDDGVKIRGRDLLKILSPNEHVFEMYRHRLDGKSQEFKLIEIRYTRK